MQLLQGKSTTRSCSTRKVYFETIRTPRSLRPIGFARECQCVLSYPISRAVFLLQTKRTSCVALAFGLLICTICRLKTKSQQASKAPVSKPLRFHFIGDRNPEMHCLMLLVCTLGCNAALVPRSRQGSPDQQQEGHIGQQETAGTGNGPQLQTYVTMHNQEFFERSE